MSRQSQRLAKLSQMGDQGALDEMFRIDVRSGVINDNTILESLNDMATYDEEVIYRARLYSQMVGSISLVSAIDHAIHRVLPAELENEIGEEISQSLSSHYPVLYTTAWTRSSPNYIIYIFLNRDDALTLAREERAREIRNEDLSQYFLLRDVLPHLRVGPTNRRLVSSDYAEIEVEGMSRRELLKYAGMDEEYDDLENQYEELDYEYREISLRGNDSEEEDERQNKILEIQERIRDKQEKLIGNAREYAFDRSRSRIETELEENPLKFLRDQELLEYIEKISDLPTWVHIDSDELPLRDLAEDMVTDPGQQLGDEIELPHGIAYRKRVHGEDQERYIYG